MIVLKPYIDQPVRGHRFSFDDIDLRDLRVIAIEASVLKRILRTFEQIIQISPPGIGGIELGVEFYRPPEFRMRLVLELRHDGFAVFSSVTRDQNSRSHVTVVMVDRGWPWNLEF